MLAAVQIGVTHLLAVSTPEASRAEWVLTGIVLLLVLIVASVLVFRDLSPGSATTDEFAGDPQYGQLPAEAGDPEHRPEYPVAAGAAPETRGAGPGRGYADPAYRTDQTLGQPRYQGEPGPEAERSWFDARFRATPQPELAPPPPDPRYAAGAGDPRYAAGAADPRYQTPYPRYQPSAPADPRYQQSAPADPRYQPAAPGDPRSRPDPEYQPEPEYGPDPRRQAGSQMAGDPRRTQHQLDQRGPADQRHPAGQGQPDQRHPSGPGQPESPRNRGRHRPDR
jgi:hypothetical protein